MPKYMMATTAIHKIGDISRDEPHLCYIREEDEVNYIGEWVEGFGFVNVKFPKSTTRELTDEEYQEFNGKRLAIGSNVLGKIDLDS